MKYSKGYSRFINDKFEIHIARENQDEFEKILNLNIIVHGETVKDYLKRIFWDHPRKKECFWLYISNSLTGEIVSSISLLPLYWNIGGIITPICEMGFVGTLEAYRGNGLIRELNVLYEEIMDEQGYLMSVIRGIPFYYRKLGYEFALPLDYRMLLDPSKIPDIKLDFLKIRQARYEDIDDIKKMYEDIYGSYFIWNQFEKNSFMFKYFNDNYDNLLAKLFIIEENGISQAYFTFGLSYDNIGYEIKSSHLNEKHCIKLLQFVKLMHSDEKKQEIDLAIREETVLADVVGNLGGFQYNSYAWQVKILDLKKFLANITTILEKRLDGSISKKLTQKIKLSNYSDNYTLSFIEGKIKGITYQKGDPREGTSDLQVPGNFLYKMILADRDFNEINHVIKDARVKKESKDLINILFPKENSFPESYY